MLCSRMYFWQSSQLQSAAVVLKDCAVDLWGQVVDLYSLFHGLFEHADQWDGLPLTEFRQPLEVQSHLEMPRILVQLAHIQRT